MTDTRHKPEAPRTARAEAKAERRLQLIDATIDCIARYGLSGTTMAKVTEIAGVSVGLANFHFEGKDGLFEAVLRHLADEQRALWQSRLQGPDRSSADLLRAVVESRFHLTICARRKLAVWFAFYGDASAREIYRRAVGDVDDERLEASAALIAEMVAEAGYSDIDPVETVLSTEAMWDGLWLNMLLYPNEYRRVACRDRAMRMIAALFPKHFDASPATGGQQEAPMTRDPRYDILFTPVKIGPVTTKNRFYQVPHCTGMGWARPRTVAEMRGVKAQGGWGVVNTEYCSIHPTSDDQLHISASLWDDGDIRSHRLMTDQVHEHGALAGAELWYGGSRSANLATRLVSMDVASRPNGVGHPFQSRAMDKEDIRNFRRWHRNAALRAKAAEFDLVYVYATHHYLLAHFLDLETNTRSDEYGGSLENRTRLVRELIEETKDAVGDRCGVVVRFSADAESGEDGQPILGERQEMFAMMAEMPDLWDINIQDYSLEMGVSRFAKEGALEPYMTWVRSMTTKPVVTVGRFTSPDTMVRMVKSGVTDLIGAARPSIADPYLPKKIEEGRLEDIRECIGCNVCYSGDSLSVPIRCTQNPTMGEEWRRGWHPEKITARGSDALVLIVGAGPAGLEAARALGLRGYRVALAEARRVLGGRVVREAALPGMSEYIRVRDYRVQQLQKMANVEVYLESRLTPQDIRDFGADHVVIATGARWRRDMFNGKRYAPIADEATQVFTPDDIMDGRLPTGPTVIFDADGYYMGGVAADRLRKAGVAVTLVTPADRVSQWAENTGEGWRVPGYLMGLGVELLTAHGLEWFDGATVRLACEHSGRERVLQAANLVLVGQRAPVDDLFTALRDAGPLPFTLARIGDAEAPAIIAAATYAGHRYAQELDCAIDIDLPMQHEKIDVGAERPAIWRAVAE